MYGRIKLAGAPYDVDLRSYKFRDVTDFSPRTAEAGNPVYSELDFYQTLSFENWQGGFGTHWHASSKQNVYLRTEGRVDTRHPGLVILWTNATKSSSDVKADGFIPFGGDFYAYSSDGVAKFNGTSWSTILTGDIVDMWHNGFYIFAVRRNDTLVYASSGAGASSDWTETGGSTNQKDFKWLQHHDGYVYAGQFMGADGSSGQYVSYDDSIDLSDIYSVSSDDPQIIPVGLPGMETQKGLTYRTDFLIPRPDGVYRIAKDRSSASRVLDYSDQTSTENFRVFIEYNGQLIYSIRDGLYAWNGVRVVPIEVPKVTDSWPYTTYGHWGNATKIGRFLFLTARTNEATYSEDLLCWDGVGFHKLCSLATEPGYIRAMAYDPARDYLWYALDDGSGNVTIYYVPFQSRSEYPYPAFPTSGTHRLITPRIAAGYRKVTKSTPAVMLLGDNCDTGCYLKLEYSIDGSTWKAWGGNDGVSNVLTSDGLKVFSNPTGEENSTLEYNYIQYAVNFVTTRSSDSPILEGLYPRLLLRPDVRWGWSFQIPIAKDKQIGTMKRSVLPKTEFERLKTLRNSKAPIEFEDIFGDTYKVYITAITAIPVEELPGGYGGEALIEQVAVLNLVQVL